MSASSIQTTRVCSNAEVIECRDYMIDAFVRLNNASSMDDKVRITTDMLEFMNSHPNYLATRPDAYRLLKEKAMTYVSSPKYSQYTALLDISNRLLNSNY